MPTSWSIEIWNSQTWHCVKHGIGWNGENFLIKSQIFYDKTPKRNKFISSLYMTHISWPKGCIFFFCIRITYINPIHSMFYTLPSDIRPYAVMFLKLLHFVKKYRWIATNAINSSKLAINIKSNNKWKVRGVPQSKRVLNAHTCLNDINQGLYMTCIKFVDVLVKAL